MLNPLVLLLAVLSVTTDDSDAAVTPSTTATAAATNASPAHDHVWVKYVARRVWVPPITSKKIVGYDEQGRPTYKEVVVRPGYYKKIYAYRCNVCGRTRKG